MSAKDILKLAVIIVGFYLAAPYLLRAVFAVFHKPVVDVGYLTPVAGRITGFYMNRQYYLYYFDNDEGKQYDFNGFGRSLASAEAHKNGLSKQELDGPGLGVFLRKGDFVRKAANSTELTVQRGDSISHWACSPNPVVE